MSCEGGGPSWVRRSFDSVAGQAAGIAREPGRVLPLGPNPEGETWVPKEPNVYRLCTKVFPKP